MKRPRQHEIDDLAENLFESSLPANIVKRKQGKDYGIDYEIEVFIDNISTGQVYKVQVKGAENLNLINNHETISYNGFPVDNAKYILKQIKIPTAFIVCDITKKETYWVIFQGNKQIEEAYNKARSLKRDSITIHLPTSNKLPITITDMLEELAKTDKIISLRKFDHIKQDDYYTYLENQINRDSIESLLKSLNEKTEIAEAKKMEFLINNNKLEQAQKLITDILNNPSSSKRAKFYSLLNREKAFAILTLPENEEINFYYWLAQELEKNTPENDTTLELITQSYKLYSVLKEYLSKDFGLYINSMIQKQQSNNSSLSLWSFELESQRVQLTNKIVELIKPIDNIVLNLLKQKQISVLSNILPRFYLSFAIFRFRLLDEGFVESSHEIENWIKNKIDLNIKLTKYLKNKKEKDIALLSCVVAYSNLTHPKINNDEYFNSAEEIKERIVDKSIKKDSLKIIKKSRELAMKKKVWDDNNPDWDGLKQMALEQANVLGVNLEILNKKQPSPGDPDYVNYKTAQIVKIGIDDLDPTYILKNCKYMIFKYTGVIGEIGRILGLNSAGMKQLGCILHPEYAHMGLSLKFLYEGLKEQCENCPDREPHPKNWVFTYPWHEKQGQKYEESLKQLKIKKDSTQ